MADKSKSKPQRDAKSTKRGSNGWFKRLALVTAIGVVALALLATLGGLVFYNQTDLPDPNADFQTNTTFIYYRDSTTKLGSLAVQNRQSIGYSAMPESIKQAVVAAENRDFWTDPGISPSGIARSAWTILRGGEMQGGSTITQQYIKILYLSSDRTLTRKLKELALAIKLGKEVSKEKILEGYLNTIYYGRGAYGIQTASKAYFNIDAKDLNVEQSAVLASVLNNPGLFDPSGGQANKDRLLERYDYVLDGMRQGGDITDAQHSEYSAALPEFPEIPVNSRYGGPKGFLLKMVEEELKAKGFKDSEINGGGLQVTTTFDSKAQDAAVAAAQSNTAESAGAAGQDPEQLHVAIASVQVGTGEVLAAYGGPDYIQNSRNWAMTPRPTASAFKAYAAVAGLRGGMTLRTELQGDTFTPPGDTVPIRNEFSYQYGPVTLQKAVQDSINTAFVDMVGKIDNGPEAVIKAATDAGLSEDPGWDPNLRIALGTAEASPLQMAGGYATLANEGKHVTNHVVKKVTDANGKVLFTAETDAKQTIEADISHDVTYALESVIQAGTGARVANLGYDIAGKTGTAGVKDDIVSAWFVAYTRQISTAVMYVAGDGGNADLDPYARPGDPTFFGGTYPAMTWADYMRVAMEGLPNEKFPGPDYVNRGNDTFPQVPVPSETTPTPQNDSQPSGASSPNPGGTATSVAPSAAQTSKPNPTQEPVQPQPSQTTRTPQAPGGQKPAAATSQR